LIRYDSLGAELVRRVGGMMDDDDPHIFITRKSARKKRKMEIGYGKAELFPACLNLKIILYIDRYKHF
jgi:hypothetical protein